MNRTQTIQKAQLNRETLSNPDHTTLHPSLPSGLVAGFIGLPETTESGLDDLAWVLGHSDNCHRNDAIGFFDLFLERIS